MTPLPAFYYRRAVPDDAAVLEKGDGFLVTRNNGVVAIECFKPWRPDFQEVYCGNGAEGVRINQTMSWKGISLDFLRHLPNLRCLHLGVDVPMDITPLGELEGLESLDLNWRAQATPGTVNVQRLDQLKECSISWHPVFARAQSPVPPDPPAPRRAALKELDLSGLPQLAELGVMSCPALTRIDLSEGSQLLALELTNCGKLIPDWPRLADDLRYLCLRGRIGFAIEEIARAHSLQHLWVEVSGRHSSDLLPVLRALPGLDGVTFIDLKAEAEVAEQVKSINEAHGHGSTLTVRPPRQVLKKGQ